MQGRRNKGNLYGIDAMRQAEDSIVKNLQRTDDFMKALSTDMGRELMADLVAIIDEKFKLIYTEEATDADHAMFRACKELGRRWNLIIDSHNQCVKVAKKLDDFKKKTLNKGE